MVRTSPSPGKPSSTDRPKALPVLADNIPADLQAIACWLAWRYVEDRDPETGEVDYDKPPLNARTGGPGSSTNKHTWSAFLEAIAAYMFGGLDGVGLALDPQEDERGEVLIAVDLDDCRNPKTGAIEPWAQAVIDAIASYTEVSPSGAGIRIFLRGPRLKRGRKKGPVEVYCWGRYVTVTGHRLDGSPEAVLSRPDALTAFLATHFPEPARQAEPSPGGGGIPHDLDDAELVRRACEDRKSGAKFRALWEGSTQGYPSSSEADLALANYLAFWCGRPGHPDRIDNLFRQSGLFRSKWKRDDYRQRTIAKALDGRTDFYDPGQVIRPTSRRGKGRSTTAPASQDDHDAGRNGQAETQHESPEVIARLLSLAEKDPDGAFDAALAADNLGALARLRDESPGDVEAFYRALKKAGATARDVAGLQQAVNREHKRAKRGRSAEFRARVQEAGNARPGDEGGPTCLVNYYEEAMVTEDGKEVVARIGHPIQQIQEQLRRLSGGWPYRVGGLLFAEAPGPAPLWLRDPAELFAWANGLLPDGGRNHLRWAAGADKVSEARFHAYLTQTARHFDAVEAFPHFPELPTHYYMHPATRGGDGKALRWLVGRFNPATQIDYDLVEAFFLSLGAGLPPGTRPAWLFTSDNDDGKGGRGAGKSTVPKIGARLFGGYLGVDHDDKMADVYKRLLSPEGLTRRVLLLDNVKTLKFSWGQLEALITCDVISGHRMYEGEGRRPNTLTICVTLNGASLSKDMAQRCVIVKLQRPAYSATWEEETNAFIERHRWEVIGDIMARLRGPGRTLDRNTRWGLWEDAVLSRAAEPSECQQAISERQGDVDEDSAEADMVRDFFIEQLRNRGHCHEREVVFIPADVAACWVIGATGERRVKPKACSYLNQLGVPELKRGRHDHSRGYLWQGPGAPWDVETCVLNKLNQPQPSGDSWDS